MMAIEVSSFKGVLTRGVALFTSFKYSTWCLVGAKTTVC